MPRNTPFPDHGNILSVDLASRKYSDNGIAFLSYGSLQPQLIKTSDLGLTGKPIAPEFAYELNQFCEQQGVRVLLLDGPQGWKSPKTEFEHMRLCERVLNTPAKTGPIGYIKPITSLRYITFSINLFHILRVDYGWKLLTEDWPKHLKNRWVVESFPSTAWQTLGLQRLPSKAKTTPRHLSKWRRDLTIATNYKIPARATHDELQATVALPAGQAIAEGNPDGVLLSGMDPVITHSGDVLEGWIVNPKIPET
ncbi:MAG: hypothetical protein A2Z14_12035 [Chloroflexi bacterium RBG_16_48_8]|nr:MAG: hypothetical protein A2Z14_12035 [Chloroflexi bacterium RBG_16_48_8]